MTLLMMTILMMLPMKMMMINSNCNCWAICLPRPCPQLVGPPQVAATSRATSRRHNPWQLLWLLLWQIVLYAPATAEAAILHSGTQTVGTCPMQLWLSYALPMCVFVCVCLRLCGCGRHSKWAWLSPTCEARPNILSACEFCAVCVRCVCVHVCVWACVGAVPKRCHCSTQRRVAASSLVLTTCCCESCCVPSSVLRARNASLDFSLLSL